MLNVVKGVVTTLPQEGVPGQIKCGNGLVFSFTLKDLDESYKPLLNDIVEVDEDDGKLIKIALYHRQGYVPPKEASVDLRVQCPFCGKKIMPKAQTKDGRVVATYCPECKEKLEEFPEELKKKTPVITWALLVISLILLAIAMWLSTN